MLRLQPNYMNTEGENFYQKIMSSNRIVFETTETAIVNYDFLFDDELLLSFKKWKAELLELSDMLPTANEELQWWNDNCLGYLKTDPSPEIKIVKTYFITKEKD